MTAAGNIVVAEAPAASMLAWLRCPELPEYLSLLGSAAAAAAAISRQQQSQAMGGGGQKRLSFAADLAEDAKLGDSCARAYHTVVEVELGQLLQPSNMAIEYLAERGACVSAAFKLAEQLELPEEVAFDGVLLMDRVMSTGTQHDSSLSMLFVAAALRVRRQCIACVRACVRVRAVRIALHLTSTAADASLLLCLLLLRLLHVRTDCRSADGAWQQQRQRQPQRPAQRRAHGGGDRRACRQRGQNGGQHAGGAGRRHQGHLHAALPQAVPGAHGHRPAGEPGAAARARSRAWRVLMARACCLRSCRQLAGRSTRTAASLPPLADAAACAACMRAHRTRTSTAAWCA